ncbi:MAG: 1,4-alpha-glucan branching protein domain-containing protein [Bacillota bacterium]
MNPRLMLVLHSHLPYVKHQGRWPFGEVWLFEAMAETYIPLLQTWLRLLDEGLPAPITLSLSPTLMEQLASPYLREWFIEYTRACERQAASDERSFMARGQRDLAEVAADYRRFYQDIRHCFTMEFAGDLIGVIKELYRRVPLELLATSATHAYLPLIHDRDSLERQIAVGKECFIKHLGFEPRGFWLPECGYYQGLEEVLERHHFSYFFVDGHAIEGGRPAQTFSGYHPFSATETVEYEKTGLSTYSPYRIKGRSMGVFGRNTMVSLQVWSKEYGYPGDANYREFHKQLPGSGLKYWRVTNRDAEPASKLVYDRNRAQETVRKHAHHFMETIEAISREAERLGYSEPLIVACYDTELFGHWWWEGVDWLEELVRLITGLKHWRMVLPGMILQEMEHLPEAQVMESSWGTGGKHFGWSNPETSWMWETIQKARQELDTISRLTGSNLITRARAQAVKELMLMESSDWFFMVTNNHTRDYAVKRFLEHFGKLVRLIDMVRMNQFSPETLEWMTRVEEEDDIF